jgi:hypothetical protein
MSPPHTLTAALTPALRQHLDALMDEGWELWAQFDREVRLRRAHSFIASDYPRVLEALLPLRAPGRRFLEWGSATGVIAVMADLLGFEAHGIEIDPALVETARDLAARHGSSARFVAGSYLPTGYRPPRASRRSGARDGAPSGYLALGRALDEYDVVFGYPWPGERDIMLDLFRRHGGMGARLLLHDESAVVVHELAAR